MWRPRFLLTRWPNDAEAKAILIPRKEVEWEGGAIFNPTVIKVDEKFVMLYRTYPNNLMETESKLYRPGKKLINDVSYIGIAKSDNGIDFNRKDKPFIAPSVTYDMFGCEDPRVTKFEDYFYITYTAIDAPLWDKEKKFKVRIALARTKDFETIEKMGVVGIENRAKAACIFPERINGKVGFIYTEYPESDNSEVKIKYFDDVEQILQTTDWSEGNTFLKTEKWLHRGPELGATPIKTKEGWLLIFSSESMIDNWSVSAALFDLKEPQKMISRTVGYILQPVTDYERNGLVPNVTFPSGAVMVGDEIWVYYGAADTVIGLASGKYEDLVKSMIKI